MGMIILLFYVIPYLAVSTVVMVITVKYAKKIWIRGIVATALFLIPTYDIIITNILGAYYCATAPKAFIKETVEYPQSIYFEDNVFGSDYEYFKHRFDFSLDGIRLKTIAFNLPDGNVAIYHYEKNQEEYHKLVSDIEKRLGRTVHDGDIMPEIFKIIDSNKTITTKESMPKMNYIAKFDRVHLNWLGSKFLFATEFKLINNKTSEIIAYKRMYRRYFYNFFPNFATDATITLRSFCKCHDLPNEIGMNFLESKMTCPI